MTNKSRAAIENNLKELRKMIAFHIQSMREQVDILDDELDTIHTDDTEYIQYLIGKRDGLLHAIEWAERDLN